MIAMRCRIADRVKRPARNKGDTNSTRFSSNCLDPLSVDSMPVDLFGVRVRAYAAASDTSHPTTSRANWHFPSTLLDIITIHMRLYGIGAVRPDPKEIESST